MFPDLKADVRVDKADQHRGSNIADRTSLMRDGIHLASNSAQERYFEIVCVKSTALWPFENPGQSCALISCRVHTALKWPRPQVWVFGQSL